MEADAAQLASIMLETMAAKDDAAKKQELQKTVQTLCEAFPVPEKFV